jgi:hypothetical protein
MSSQEAEAEDWLCGGSGGEWRHGRGNVAAMDRHGVPELYSYIPDAAAGGLSGLTNSSVLKSLVELSDGERLRFAGASVLGWIYLTARPGVLKGVVAWSSHQVSIASLADSSWSRIELSFLWVKVYPVGKLDGKLGNSAVLAYGGSVGCYALCKPELMLQFEVAVTVCMLTGRNSYINSNYLPFLCMLSFLAHEGFERSF